MLENDLRVMKSTQNLCQTGLALALYLMAWI